MNVIIILNSSQLNHLNPTSRVVRVKCTLKVSIVLRTVLLQLSILKNLLHNHSISSITRFPTASISPATTSSERDINPLKPSGSCTYH